MCTCVSVSGSRNRRRASFEPLQLRHARARLSMSFPPPCARGTRCSTSKGLLKNSSGARQYSHWWFARRATAAYCLGGTPAGLCCTHSIDPTADFVALYGPAAKSLSQSSHQRSLAQAASIVKEIGAVGAKLLLQAGDHGVGLLVGLGRSATTVDSAAHQLTSSRVRLAVSGLSALPLRAGNGLEQSGERERQLLHESQYRVDTNSGEPTPLH